MPIPALTDFRPTIPTHTPKLNDNTCDTLLPQNFTTRAYDITHRAARLLKRRLDRDVRWAEFNTLVSRTRSQIQQTELAPLAPPTVGTKGRFMNLDPLVRWGEQTLALLQNPSPARLGTIPADRLKEKLGWLREFAVPLREWSEFHAVIEPSLEFVREESRTTGCDAALREMRRPGPEPSGADTVAETVLVRAGRIVSGASGRTFPGQHGGSRVVFWSIQISGAPAFAERVHQPDPDILPLGALVSETTATVVTKALTTVQTKDVWSWCRTRLGPTVQPIRAHIYNPGTKPA